MLTLQMSPDQLRELFAPGVSAASASARLADTGAKTKKVDGVDLPASAFLIVGDPDKTDTWNLPVHFPDEAQSKSHIQNAMSRFNQVEGSFDRKKVAGELARLAKSKGIDVKDFKKQLSESTDVELTEALPDIFSDSEYANGTGSLSPNDKGVVTASAAGKPNPELHHMAWLLSELTPIQRDGKLLYKVPICVTGSWVKGTHKFSITDETLNDIVKNFAAKGNGQVVIDYEHASEDPSVARGGPVPASGWIHGLQKESVGSLPGLTALVEWTPEAKAMLDGGAYRFFSPAIDWGKADKKTGKDQGATLTSGALTNHPFLEELPPLMLTDLMPDAQLADTKASTPAASKETKMAKKLKLRKTSGGVGMFDDTGKQVGFGKGKFWDKFDDNDEKDPDSTCEMSEDMLDKQHNSPQGNGLPDQLSEKTAKVETKTKRAPAVVMSECLSETGRYNTAQIVGFVAAGELEPAVVAEADAINIKLDELAKEGKILPPQRAALAEFAFGSPAKFATLAASLMPQVNLGVAGISTTTDQSDTTPGSELLKLAKQRLSEHKLPTGKYEDGWDLGRALDEVSREHPEMWNTHSRKVMASDKSGSNE